ncbi:hypothetical protein ACOMHN_063348 [Nucella lapillus]
MVRGPQRAVDPLSHCVNNGTRPSTSGRPAQPLCQQWYEALNERSTRSATVSTMVRGLQRAVDPLSHCVNNGTRPSTSGRPAQPLCQQWSEALNERSTRSATVSTMVRGPQRAVDPLSHCVNNGPRPSTSGRPAQPLCQQWSEAFNERSTRSATVSTMVRGPQRAVDPLSHCVNNGPRPSTSGRPAQPLCQQWS